MEKANPKFTVNLACYNQLPVLKLILKALAEQPFKDIEVIVCDDGSSDGTKQFFADADYGYSTMINNGEILDKIFIPAGNMYWFPITYFWQEDKGFRLSKSKNNGIKEASGDYFVSIECDVIPHKNLLQEYNMWAEPFKVLLGVRHDIEGIPDDINGLDDKIVSKDFRLSYLNTVSKVSKPWRMCSGCNFLMPTPILKSIGGWNEEFKHYGIDDYEVCARLYAAGCMFEAVPGAYGYHIRHDIRTTVDENQRLLEEAERKLGL